MAQCAVLRADADGNRRWRHDKSLAVSAGKLAALTVQNASFCRVWLFDLLSSDDPGSNPFSRAWFESAKAFCKSNHAVPDIDAEAYAAFTLTAYLRWPIWMHAEKPSRGRSK